MPFIVALLAVALLVLVIIVLIPVSLVQRYRVGTSRRLARPWVATLNVVTIGLSTVLFMIGAAIANVWVPQALSFAGLGLLAGCALGVLGLSLTRWEATPPSLYYTPNRWLVLAITLAVTSRIIYGFWRGWQAWRSLPADTSWLAASGAAGSLAAGALVLGYYLTYWAGVRRRATRHPRTSR